MARRVADACVVCPSLFLSEWISVQSALVFTCDVYVYLFLEADALYYLLHAGEFSLSGGVAPLRHQHERRQPRAVPGGHAAGDAVRRHRVRAAAGARTPRPA